MDSYNNESLWGATSVRASRSVTEAQILLQWPFSILQQGVRAVVPDTPVHILALYTDWSTPTPLVSKHYDELFATPVNLPKGIRKWISPKPILSDAIRFVVFLLPSVFGAITFALFLSGAYFYNSNDIGMLILVALATFAFLAFTAITARIRSAVKKRKRRNVKWGTSHSHDTYSGLLSRA